MAAPVRLEARAFGDPRYVLLGELAGYNHYEAFGRMAYVYSACTERGTAVLSEAWIRACLGPSGVEAIMGSELGGADPDGIRIKGASDEQIGWYVPAVEKRKALAQRAGQARAAGAPRDGLGRLLSSARPADIQHASSAEPAPDQRNPASRVRTPSLLSLSSSPPDVSASPLPQTRARACKPEPPEAGDLADCFREHLLVEKQDHAVGDEATWPKRRAAWAKTFAALLRKGRTPQRSAELIAWVFGDQGGSEYRFVVESPVSFAEKWDRLDKAANRKAPARASPRHGRGLSPQEILDLDMSESPFALKGGSE